MRNPFELRDENPMPRLTGAGRSVLGATLALLVACNALAQPGGVPGGSEAAVGLAPGTAAAAAAARPAVAKTSPIAKSAISATPLMMPTAGVASAPAGLPAGASQSAATQTAPLQVAATESSAAAPPAATQTKGAPEGFVAPAEPQADETNAQRAKSQPLNNAPFWRAVQQSGEKAGVTSLPGPELGVLVQRFVQYPGSNFTTAGEAWRQVRNYWILPYGGALLAITLLALAIFYWSKGSLGGHEPDTGRKIERFTPLERAAHWTNAIAFVLLAVSGLVMSFGKFVLMPWMGHTIFGFLTYLLKNVHNFAGPLFAVSLIIVFIIFVRDNFPGKGDLAWLLRGGGIFGGGEVPSHRFNAGEKVLFWGGVFCLGVLVVSSGFVLDMLLPGLEYLRGDMQIAQIIHGGAALLMVAMFLGHIYMGTIGMKGAYNAMSTGYVDEAWAKEHHSLWYEDIKAGKIPSHRSTADVPVVRAAVGAAR